MNFNITRFCIITLSFLVFQLFYTSVICRNYKSLRNETDNIGIDPKCSIRTNATLREGTSNATIISNRAIRIICSTEKTDSNFTWKFNGNEFNSTSGNAHFIKHATLMDMGSYSCHWQTGKASGVKYLYLYVIRYHPQCSKPEDEGIHPEGTKFARIGDVVNWTCCARVGERWSYSDHSMTFYKESNEGPQNLQNLKPKPIINITLMNDILTGKLSMRISKNSFGKYYCNITNHGESVTLNFQVIKGLSSHDEKIGTMKAFTLALCGCLAVFVIFSYWWHFKDSIVMCWTIEYKPIYFQEEEIGLHPQLGIIHGHDTEEWVFNYLLPIVEDYLSYNCYVPMRDIKAGQNIMKEVSTVIPKCSQIFVIISQSLFESDYSAVGLRYAIGSAIGRRGKLISIVLQGFDKVCLIRSEDRKMIETLKTLTTVQFPNEGYWRPFSVEKMQSIFDYVLYVREGQELTNRSIGSIERLTYEDAVHGSRGIKGNRDSHTMSDRLDSAHEQTINANSYKKNKDKKMFWRTLWMQTVLAFNGSAETRFWFNVLLLLPDTHSFVSTSKTVTVEGL